MNEQRVAVVSGGPREKGQAVAVTPAARGWAAAVGFQGAASAAAQVVEETAAARRHTGPLPLHRLP